MKPLIGKRTVWAKPSAAYQFRIFIHRHLSFLDRITNNHHDTSTSQFTSLSLIPSHLCRANIDPTYIGRQAAARKKHSPPPSLHGINTRILPTSICLCTLLDPLLSLPILVSQNYHSPPSVCLLSTSSHLNIFPSTALTYIYSPLETPLCTVTCHPPSLSVSESTLLELSLDHN